MGSVGALAEARRLRAARGGLRGCDVRARQYYGGYRIARVLVLAYYFPPMGGGGVQRTVKFCQYLVDCGYEPVVVTGSGAFEDRWAPKDPTLAAEIPPGVEIHRVPGPEPTAPPTWRARADRLFDLMPQTWRWWIDGAVDLGLRVGRDADVILGELVPYGTAHAAARLSGALRRPWVADLQDPWALDEMWLYPSVVHRLRDVARMRRLLGSASAIVMNTPEAATRIRRGFPELASRVTEPIPNGFDPEDFTNGAVDAVSSEGFRIAHTGYLHTEEGLRQRRTGRVRKVLGGEPIRGVDLLTRSHVYLLEAIDQLLAAEPSLAATLEVHFAGVLSEADRAVAATSPVARLHGYLSHSDTIALVRSAHLLFLPMHDLPPGVRSGIVPGKTYEYLGSGRPILAAVPEGDARDLLREAGNALLCRPSDVSGMAQLLSTQIAAWQQGVTPSRPAAGVVARYERQRQTMQLARVLDGVQHGAGDHARLSTRVSPAGTADLS